MNEGGHMNYLTIHSFDVFFKTLFLMHRKKELFGGYVLGRWTFWGLKIDELELPDEPLNSQD